ncbi:DUF4255 domain-containing protein [Methanosarcina sp. WWM596]|uniref:DUF4255 domain-containing protein n=1 Tax=Methanosarcina sp. WWM596 TaxID=1434103 RepID=UPI000615E9AD|nr:DUF4255 domain-containing protein [Methanosarcina sp. WWM596]AKB18659.1 hypothetical protein MSWHS_1796 [Methanosarcina sp. WWM596]
MSDYGAITDIGETLIELLRDNMEDLIPKQSIVLASPGEIEDKDNVRLSLFLYQVIENVHLKNQEMQMKNSTTIIFPPIALDLYYMLTSHISSGEHDLTEKTREEHSILGRAIQILNDNPTLTGSVLKGNLDRNEAFHMSITSLSLDDLSKIWTTFQGKPFRPSICYLVTPVMIGSGREITVHRVVSKEAGYNRIVPE